MILKAQFARRCCKVTKKAVILPRILPQCTLWTRSSMDRIKDSGSFDWGSTPHGFTFVVAK